MSNVVLNNFIPVKIRRLATDPWYSLPVPVKFGSPFNAIDSDNDGRNNNDGGMFRDIIALKNTIPIEFPEMDNVTTAEIISRIKHEEFQCYYPDTSTGAFETKWFYCASGGPTNIKEFTSKTTWINEGFTMDWVEM